MPKTGPITELLPLYSIEAEMSLLGAMLLSREECDEIIPVFKSEYFYHPAHRLVFSVIEDLSRAGRSVSVLTVSDELELTGDLAEVGGSGYLQELCRFKGPERALDAAHIVFDRWTRRDDEDIARTLIGMVHGGNTIAQRMEFKATLVGARSHVEVTPGRVDPEMAGLIARRSYVGTELARCMFWLAMYLQDGPKRTGAVWLAAEAAGYNTRMVKRARKGLDERIVTAYGTSVFEEKSKACWWRDVKNDLDRAARRKPSVS